MVVVLCEVSWYVRRLAGLSVFQVVVVFCAVTTDVAVSCEVVCEVFQFEYQ